MNIFLVKIFFRSKKLVLVNNYPNDCAIISKHSSAMPSFGLSVYYRESSKMFCCVLSFNLCVRALALALLGLLWRDGERRLELWSTRRESGSRVLYPFGQFGMLMGRWGGGGRG